MELRLLAVMSGEPLLVSAYRSDQDVHALTASLLYNVPLGQVTPEQRQQGKRTNFGVVYGMGPRMLADRENIPYQEAKDLLDTFRQRYPKVRGTRG